MYLYKDNFKKALHDLKKKAFDVYLSFLKEKPIEKIIAQVEALDLKHENIIKLLPSQVKNKSDCGRHIYWLKYWLQQKKPLKCIDDIQDICETDIDEIEEQFDKWCYVKVNVDKYLVKAINTLLENREFNAAVIQSFKLLTERLRRKYKIKNLDGCKLIDAIYSQAGKADEKLSNSTKEGLLYLMKGLYTLFRNEHAHNKLKTKPYESEAVISMINYLLLRLKYSKI